MRRTVRRESALLVADSRYRELACLLWTSPAWRMQARDGGGGNEGAGFTAVPFRSRRVTRFALCVEGFFEDQKWTFDEMVGNQGDGKERWKIPPCRRL